MLGAELLACGPEAPLAAGRAAELACLAPTLSDADRSASLPFSAAGGRALGRVFGKALDARAPYVCAIGAFDGFHLGHRALLSRAADEARLRGARLAAVTFSPDPADVLSGPRAGSRLLDTGRRVASLLSAGADSVVVFGFDRAFAGLGYREFVLEALGGLVGLSCLVVGRDFNLGRGGEGDVRSLAALGQERGFGVVGVELTEADGSPVTSTRIRGLVRQGSVEAAAGLLGRPHMVAGTVRSGRGEGSAFGFPTANIVCDAAICLPEQGVYAALVSVPGEGRASAWPAAVNVGLPPTFSEEDGASAFMEANLIGFAGDLYGLALEVSLLRWLRDSRPFDSVDELRRTVLGNIEWCARTLGDGPIDLRTR